MEDLASDVREPASIRVRYAALGIAILVAWKAVECIPVGLLGGPLPLWLRITIFPIGQTLFLILYPIWAARRCGSGPLLKWLGARPFIREAFIGIGCAFALTLALGGIEFALFGGMFDLPEQFRKPIVSQDSLDQIVMCVLALTIVPFGEELFFRGLVYGALRRWTVPGALAAQALLFSLYHQYGLTYSIFLFAGGVLFGIVYEWRRTLWAPIFMHLTCNIISVTLLVAAFIAYGNTPVLGVALENHNDGCRITRVLPNSTAEEAALKVGDMVISIDDQPVSSPDELITAMKRFKLGHQVRIEIERDGGRMTVKAILNKRLADQTVP